MKLRAVCGASSTASSNSIVPFAVSMKMCGESARRDELGSSYGAIGSPGTGPHRRAVVAGGIELREQLGGMHPHRPVLVGERLLDGAAVASRPPYSASADRMAARASIAASPCASVERLAQRLGAARRLQLADDPRRRGANDEVRLLQLRERDGRRSGALRRARRGQHRGHDPAILVAAASRARARSQRPAATSRAPPRAPPERSIASPAPCRRAPARNSSASIAAAARKRRRAHRRPWIGQEILDDRERLRWRAACRAPSRPRDGCSGRPRRSELDQRRDGAAIADRLQRANRRRQRPRAASRPHSTSAISGSTAAGSLSLPRPRAANAGGIFSRPLEHLQQRRLRARCLRCARARTRPATRS